MGKNKKFAVIITEEKNGRSETSKVYADSVTDAMNYIALIKNKKAKVRIIDGNENLIHSEDFNTKKEHKDKEKEENKKKKEEDDDKKDKKDKDKKDKEHHGPLHYHGNGHWSHEEPRDDDDDDYMYA